MERDGVAPEPKNRISIPAARLVGELTSSPSGEFKFKGFETRYYRWKYRH